MAGPDDMRRKGDRPLSPEQIAAIDEGIKRLRRQENELLLHGVGDPNLKERLLREIAVQIAALEGQKRPPRSRDAVDVIISPAQEPTAPTPTPVHETIITPPAPQPTGLGDETPRVLPEVGDDNGKEVEGVENHEQRLRGATEFLGAGLHFFAQDVLGMEFDNSFSSALFTNDAYLRQQMEARGLTLEEISTVQRASAAYINASRLIHSGRPASEWVVEGGVDILERCRRYAASVNDLITKYTTRESAPVSPPTAPPSGLARGGRQPREPFDYRKLFAETSADEGGVHTSAGGPDEFNYLNVSSAPTPGAPAATWNSDVEVTRPQVRLRGTGSPRRGVRETVRNSLRDSKGEKIRARLDTLGVDLVERYRMEFERRARPEGEAIMQRDGDRGRALVEAESRPALGWTRRDTDMYIVALGGKKLQHDVNEALGKFLDGILGGNLKKAVMDSYRAYRAMGKVQILELPKGYKEVYKRGEAIIESYHKRLKERKLVTEVESKIDAEEKQKLDAANLSDDERVLYLKIRARKIPFPKKPSEWRVFSKVWGIRDIRKVASSRQVRVEGGRPEAQETVAQGQVVSDAIDPATLSGTEMSILDSLVGRKIVTRQAVDKFLNNEEPGDDNAAVSKITQTLSAHRALTRHGH